MIADTQLFVAALDALNCRTTHGEALAPIGLQPTAAGAIMRPPRLKPQR